MSSSCPVCGGRFGLVDRLAHPPICHACEKSGVRAPKTIVRVREAKTDRGVARACMIAAVVFAGFVVLISDRVGTSPAVEATLLVFAAAAFGAGLVQSAAASRTLRHGPK